MTQPNKNKSNWWVAALITPYVGLFIGWLLSTASRHRTNFWIDGEPISRLSCGLIPAIVLGLCFTVASFRKREKYAGWTMFGWLGAMIIILALVAQ
jgi:hypothetical protein